MIDTFSDPRLFPDVRVADLALYLQRQGWRRVEHPNHRLLVFEPHTAQGPSKLVFASSDDYDDSPRMIAKVLEVLAGEQGVALQEVARSVHSIDRDILSVRLMGAHASSRGLPLDSAMNLVSQLRDFLAYAACVEENPRPYFPKATSIGRQYTGNCVFGHTFPGSFGFTIESPTGPGPFGSPDETAEPFERRVMGRILRGLNDLREAVLSGSPEMLATRYQQGLNANLCEVLEDTLKQSDDAEIEYSVAWSPEWPVPADLRAVRTVRLEQRAASFLSAAARQMRSVEESKAQTITGRVVALQSDGTMSDDQSGEDLEQIATILWTEQKGRKLRVRVSLEPTDYALACDAHKAGEIVCVSGRIEKQGKFWTLMAPNNLTRA